MHVNMGNHYFVICWSTINAMRFCSDEQPSSKRGYLYEVWYTIWIYNADIVIAESVLLGNKTEIEYTYWVELKLNHYE